MPTLTIELSEERLRRLERAAEQKTPSALVEEALDARLPWWAGMSVAEGLKDFIGAGGDGPATDASRMDEVISEILEEKHRTGHF